MSNETGEFDEVFAAVVLAGGRARRFGGEHKPALQLNGRSLLDHSLLAVADAEPIVVVGPEISTMRPVHWVREDPSYAGPVAALATGLQTIGNIGVVALLSADLIGIKQHTVHRLRSVVHGDVAGAVLIDASGREQWLISVWCTKLLRKVIPSETIDVSLHSVFAGLSYVRVPAEPGEADDIDTPADLHQLSTQVNPDTDTLAP